MHKFREPLLLLTLAALFLLVRLPGLSLPYYQDEWKNVAAASAGASAAGSFFAHPPLTALLFEADASLFGTEHMRLLPLLFGLLSLILLYAVMRRRAGSSAALVASGLYAFSFYGIWSSLMIDTDGAILPSVFLLSLYCYDRFREGGASAHRWLAALIVSLLLGLMVKLSFILVVGALILDFFWEERRALSRSLFARIGLLGAIFIGIVLFVFVLVHALLPSFSIMSMIAHADSYVRFTGRGYLQILVQGLKALYYLSPLILVPLLFLPLVFREAIRKTSPFIAYLGVGCIFYFVLFDFSQGALDKYLMFSIIPLAAISGVVLARLLEGCSFRAARIPLAAGIALSLLVCCVNLLPQAVIPLYPKTAWFSWIAHGHFATATPFMGGSGPLPFYVSFFFIVLSFLLASSAALAALRLPVFRPTAVIVVLCLGLSYNLVFAEELSFGKLNGSATTASAAALSFIAESPEVATVLTYSDIGAWGLRSMGKYAGRFYAAPQFEQGHQALFRTFNGHYLVVGIPPLYEGFYKDFFATCGRLFTTKSGLIDATVYTCEPTKP